MLITFSNEEERYWNIPKGLMEEGETPYDTILRELWEETSIVMVDKGNTYRYLGRFPYIRGKKELELFYITLSKSPVLKCNSLTEDGKPEISKYNWIDPKGFSKYFSPNLVSVIYHVIHKGLL